ncbi:hypothetical protein ABW286_02125 [Erwinia papayae]|uniref:Uncharacterized protein n=1 Tax=Erwinia papayae TaxID=206499 RepID=A0ABV3MWT2_9GAMM
MVRIVKQLPQVIFVCTFVVPATSSPARRKAPGGKKGQQKTEKKGSTYAVNMQFSPADTYEPKKKIQKKIFAACFMAQGQFIHIRRLRRCNQLSTIPVDKLVHERLKTCEKRERVRAALKLVRNLTKI